MLMGSDLLELQNLLKLNLNCKEILEKSDESSKKNYKSQTRILTLGRCPRIPISSPLGHFLIERQSKTVLSTDYLNGRLDRLDKISAAPPILPGVPRLIPAQIKDICNPKTLKIKEDYERIFQYPQRHFRRRKLDEDMQYLRKLLIENEEKKRTSCHRANPIEVIDLCKSDSDNDEGDTKLSSRSYRNMVLRPSVVHYSSKKFANSESFHRENKENVWPKEFHVVKRRRLNHHPQSQNILI